jgi:hypothetical protein
MLSYNSTYAGRYYQLQGGEIYVLRGDGRFAYAGAVVSNIVTVQLTGYYRTGADGSLMYQTTSDGWIAMIDGWKQSGYSSLTQYSQADAEYYVKRMIKNNARVLENNLLCARFADKLSEDQRALLYQLQNRLQNRNSKLLNDGYCQDVQVSTPPGYNLLESELNVFMQNYPGTVSGIGLVISTTTLVVSAIVIASLATAAYFAYKALWKESKEDVKYSDELTQILLTKLTPEEYEQLRQETQGMVTKAKIKSRFSNTMDILKWGLIGFGCYTLYKAVEPTIKQSKLWRK